MHASLHHLGPDAKKKNGKRKKKKENDMNLYIASLSRKQPTSHA
ncbi:hypothetical protein PspLS_02179 [Pyricularia sp. CBS 133598]|nr:hypothetical protein PspLS_02179 [Pyricularia sp. CBS 133598]